MKRQGLADVVGSRGAFPSEGINTVFRDTLISCREVGHCKEQQDWPLLLSHHVISPATVLPFGISSEPKPSTMP